MDVFALLSTKSFFALLFTVIAVGRQLKPMLIDDIDEDQRPYVMMKVAQATISYFLMYYSIRNLPLVEVSLVNNMVPILIAILSFLILSERLKLREVAALLISFAGITILVLEHGNKEKEEGDGTLWAFVALFAACLSIALGFLLLR
jgi:drug/metabolite transporter (DMT)-like permease